MNDLVAATQELTVSDEDTKLLVTSLESFLYWHQQLHKHLESAGAIVDDMGI